MRLMPPSQEQNTWDFNVSEEPEELELVSPISPVHSNDDDTERNETAQWANNARRHHREYSHSVASETTIFGRHSSDDNFHDSNGAKVPSARRLGSGIFGTLEWMLVFGGLAQLLTGIIVYTGTCSCVS